MLWETITLKARIKGVKLESLTPDKQIMTSLPYPHLVPFDHYRLPNYEFPLTEDFDDDISHGTTMLSFIAAGKEGDGIHGVAYEASAFVIAADIFSTDIITPEESGSRRRQVHTGASSLEIPRGESGQF